jgi:hypothetical protein
MPQHLTIAVSDGAATATVPAIMKVAGAAVDTVTRTGGADTLFGQNGKGCRKRHGRP